MKVSRTPLIGGWSWNSLEAGVADFPRGGWSRARTIAVRALPFVVLATAFSHALALSWRKWGNLVVDTGRELDLPRRILEGQALYRDLRYYYGPLPPYLNAFLYRVFGVHLDVLVWAGIISAALICVALLRISILILGRWGAVVVGISFVYLCGFAHLYMNPTFNFVLPYTFAATYGVLCGFWSLAFLVEHVRTGRLRSFALSLLFLALTAFSKAEPFAAIAAAHLVFIAASPAMPGRRTRFHWAGYAGAAAVIVAVYSILTVRIGTSLWSENLAGVVNAGSRAFVRRLMGLEDPAASVRAIAVSAASLAAVLVLSWAIARLSKAPRHRAIGWMFLAAVATVSFAVYRMWELNVHYRALPLVMAGGIVFFSIQFWREADRRDEWLCHLLLWSFALGCLLRILFNVAPHHYGFYLLPASLICLGAIFFCFAPRLAGGGLWTRSVFAAAGTGLFAASCSFAVADSAAQYQTHSEELSTFRGRLWLTPEYSLASEAVRYLSQFPSSTRVLAIPEGAGLVFFSGLEEADQNSSLLPMEVVGAKGDAALLERMRARPPDLIVWLAVSLEEFGFRAFGIDYAQRSLNWIVHDYVPLTRPDLPLVVLGSRRIAASAGAYRELRDVRRPIPGNLGSDVYGVVLGVEHESRVSFLRIRSDNRPLWVAIPRTNLHAGSKVAIVNARSVPFETRGLRRKPSAVLAGWLDSFEDDRPFEVLTAGEILQRRDDLRNGEVTVRGRVSASKPGIMGRNFIQLGDDGHEIGILTRDFARPGELLTVQGIVRLDFAVGDRVLPVVLESGRMRR